MNPDFRSNCWLMKNGVPFHMVFKVDELMRHEKFAMTIVFSEFEGAKFNFDSWSWEEKK